MPKKKVKTRNLPASSKTPVRDWVYGGLLLIVIAIMPLVVRFAIIVAPPELFALFGRELYGDFFSYYKGWALGIPATIIALNCIFEYFTGGIKNIDFKAIFKSPVVIASAVFLLMALISTLFSSYRHTSWHGTADRGEGIFILFAYFIVLFAAMFYVKGSKHAKLLMYGFAFSSIIMGLIGLSQFMERDFFLTSFGQWVLTVGLSQQILDAIAAEGGVGGAFEIAYGTLYNPNTFGKYTAMAAPILFACALAYDEKRDWKAILIRLAFFVGGGLMLVGVFGSRSLGGFIGIGAAIGITLVTVICRLLYQFNRRKAEKLQLSREQFQGQASPSRKAIGWAVGVAAIGLLGLGLFFVPAVNQRVDLALERLQASIMSEPAPVNTMAFDGDSFTMITDGYERFTMVLDRLGEPLPGPMGALIAREQWHIYDTNGQLVPLASRTGPPEGEEWPYTYVYAIPGYRSISIESFPDFIIYRGLAMTFSEGRVYALDIVGNMIDMAEPIPAIGFYGRETWGSNRGHIWSRSFPLMPSRTIIGSGPDTYVQVFPQHDVIGKMFSHGSPYTLMDKAHNVYMQTWINTGGISTIALIFLFGYYLFTTFVSLIRSNMKEGIFLHGLRFGLLAGISAFCVAAMATDSTIGSSGVFYLLLGLGFGVNMIVKHMYREAEDKEPEK